MCAMNIVIAEPCGFCFGVRRAVEVAEEACEGEGSRVYMLGEIIHNRHVMGSLIGRGARVIADIDELPSGEDVVVVIRAHGVGRAVHEELAARGMRVLDATCPKVKKVHEIVARESAAGKKIVIFGGREHPETIAHIGWSDGAAVISEPSEIDGVINGDGEFCLVAQTTMSVAKWDEIKRRVQGRVNISVHDTICNATAERQDAARALAGRMGAMVVVGDLDSSNSKKLYEIAKMVCDRTFFIESAEQLPMGEFHKGENIGLTAGASTPEWIIEEVTKKMADEKSAVEVVEKSFAEQFEETMVELYTGQIVEGIVIGVTPTEIVLDLGFKSDGVISGDEISAQVGVKPSDIAKVGDKISAFVVRVNDVDGNVKLSLRKLEQMANVEQIKKALEDKTVIKGKVARVVNGGLIVNSSDVGIFVPASHAGRAFIEDLSVMIGKEVGVRIIEIDQRRRKVIGSIKLASDEVRGAKNAEFWENVFIGQEIKGTVKTLTSFGAFVDLGGVDGLVHISELSWGKIKHPDEVVAVGDEVDVYIKGLDMEKKKISLGYRKAADNPWLKIAGKISEGDVVKCKIVRIVPFGAFAEIFPDVDGLIHISQLDIKRVANVASVVSIGQEVEAKVISIDMESEKINLSMAALMDGYMEPGAVVVEEEAVAVEEDEVVAEEVVVVEEVKEAVEEAAVTEEVVEVAEEAAVAAEEVGEDDEKE